MMIKPAVYECLTPEQRVIAAMEALGRNDESEVERLRKTCEFRTYRQRDDRFAGVMERLALFGMATECDLRGAALSWVAGGFKDDNCLQLMAVHHAAWLGALAEFGVTSRDGISGATPPCHPVVARILECAIPEPDVDALEPLRAQLVEWLRG